MLLDFNFPDPLAIVANRYEGPTTFGELEVLTSTTNLVRRLMDESICRQFQNLPPMSRDRGPITYKHTTCGGKHRKIRQIKKPEPISVANCKELIKVVI